MLVHGENSTRFLFLPDPDPDPGNDAGDSSGVSKREFFEVSTPLKVVRLCVCLACSVCGVLFREIVVGVGGRTVDASDIVD